MFANNITNVHQQETDILRMQARVLRQRIGQAALVAFERLQLVNAHVQLLGTSHLAQQLFVHRVLQTTLKVLHALQKEKEEEKEEAVRERAEERLNQRLRHHIDDQDSVQIAEFEGSN